MRIITIGVLMLILNIGCANMQKKYARVFKPVDQESMVYKNKDIEFTYAADTSTSAIPIEIKNLSKETIKIIWDEVSFINQNGTSEKIIHEGVRLMTRNESMAPTVVPTGAKVQDSLSLSSKIEFIGGVWSSYPICGAQYDPWRENIDNEKDCVGKTFGIYFVYEIGGKRKDFTVKFKYESLTDITPKPPEQKK